MKVTVATHRLIPSAWVSCKKYLEPTTSHVKVWFIHPIDSQPFKKMLGFRVLPGKYLEPTTWDKLNPEIPSNLASVAGVLNRQQYLLQRYPNHVTIRSVPPGPNKRERKRSSSNHHFSGATVDGRNPAPEIHVNNGINYQPQLVSRISSMNNMFRNPKKRTAFTALPRGRSERTPSHTLPASRAPSAVFNNVGFSVSLFGV